jgi:hypothetical protein
MNTHQGDYERVINDPPIEEDDVGNALLGGFVGGTLEFIGSGAVDLGELALTELGAYASEEASAMPSDQGPQEPGGQTATHDDAAPPGFDMEQNAAPQGFDMEQDAALQGLDMMQDAAVDVGLVDTPPGSDMSTADPYGGFGLANYADNGIDYPVDGPGDQTHESGQPAFDDTPDPGDIA